MTLVKDLQTISNQTLCFLENKFNSFSLQSVFCRFHNSKYIWFDNSKIDANNLFKIRYNINRRKISKEILQLMNIYDDVKEQEQMIQVSIINKQWQCSNCSFLNQINNVFCKICGNPNQNMQNKIWNCDNCSFINNLTYFNCISCNIQNPNYAGIQNCYYHEKDEDTDLKNLSSMDP